MDAFLKFFEGFGIDSKYILALFGILLMVFVFVNFIDVPTESLGFIVATAPVWLPFTLFFLFFEAWLDYVRKEFDWAQGRTTLEIRLPQEILKSPEAMELVLVQMHQTAGPDNHIETYIDGKKPPTYGLEIVSRHGEVSFYINTPKKKFKNLIETQLYAQYPGIEVYELDIDYTAEIPWNPKKYSMMVFHYGLKKADAYPIKTYIDYGLKDMPKEEEKVDPIATVLETLGSIGQGEYMWIQILIDANRAMTFKEGSLHKTSDWTGPARDEIKKIIENAVKRAGAETKGNAMQLLTDTERDTVKAIERSLAKPAFNTAIRGIYLAQKENFQPGERIGAMNTMWRTYDDLNRNAIGVRWRSGVDWKWWQDRGERNSLKWKEEELDRHKRRAYENYSGADTKKVLTTEELATIFHFPGKVVTTPTLNRIPSKRSEAPSNLPVG
ncbi:MAG TPA: hypothetical protein VFV22_01880 [Candidatus Paceibacterota bacterium]|nr:hypothetical protein [Candidatus Paceibacterota bacterium]